MREGAEPILWLFALSVLALPVLVGLAGLAWPRRPGEGGAAISVPSWQFVIASTLGYALAFNLVFLWQELSLVVPKALVPGLNPTLYHNNHDWAGSASIAELLQGTGAIGMLLLGVVAWIAERRTASPNMRLLLIWIAFSAVYQTLPQVPVGAMLAGNDVGRAMDALGMTAPARLVATLIALTAIAAMGFAVARRLLAFAPDPLNGRSARIRWLAWTALIPAIVGTALIPAIVGTALIIPFRIPGAVDQVVIVPVAVCVIGIFWVMASAWIVRASTIRPGSPGWRFYLVGLAAIFALFHLLLAPGLDFF